MSRNTSVGEFVMHGFVFLHVITRNLIVMWIAPISTNAIHQMMTIMKMRNGSKGNCILYDM